MDVLEIKYIYTYNVHASVLLCDEGRKMVGETKDRGRGNEREISSICYRCL